MGQLTLDLFSGGAVLLTPVGNSTLRWWLDRRVQTIRPTGAGFTMTMDTAGAYPHLPWGPAVVVICPSGANSFTLAATGWTVAMTAGKAVVVHRVKNGGTAQAPTPQWWPMVYNILT